MINKAILNRAKELIIANPSSGKNTINRRLRSEYGIGLRSITILNIKKEVATENPKLAPSLYQTGGVPPHLQSVYNDWRTAGFLPFEARELTMGHKDKFDAKAVFDSIPAQQARDFRMQIIREQKGMGWTSKHIRDNILDFYRKSKSASPWEHIRAEYKPREKKDFLTYKQLVQRRAKSKQRRLLRKYKK